MKRSKSQNLPWSVCGFTFVEVLAAMVFLGILMPVVIGALTVSNRAAVATERSGIAAQLAENELNELMVTNTWSNGASRGDFGADWPGYTWELKQANWAADSSVTELTLTVLYSVQGQEQRVSLTTLATATPTQ